MEKTEDNDWKYKVNENDCWCCKCCGYICDNHYVRNLGSTRKDFDWKRGK